MSHLHRAQLDRAELLARLRPGAHDARARPAAIRHAFHRAFPGTLGMACFGDTNLGLPVADTDTDTSTALDIPIAQVPMARLRPASEHGDGHSEACVEIWQCDADDLQTGQREHLHYRFSEGAGVVFGCLTVYETAHDNASPLEHAAYVAYRELFGLLNDLRMPHPVRIWNAIAAINAEQRGSERYRQFNAGRQRAFTACRRALSVSVPAASALGTHVDADVDAAVLNKAGVTPPLPLVVYFLASREPSDAIENPRQVSAYRYPKQYGPCAPTFARAAAWPAGRGAHATPALFISGTASIVGHETLHRGDVIAQTRETLDNIAAVLAQAGRQGHRAFGMSELSYKVYLRDPAALQAIDAVLRARCGANASVLYLHADICRSDLLVEIEASGGHLALVAP
ncbi:endoribonuclease L-PSP [Trinickia sp. LjRoot230]|uniref:chorismate transformation enzyme, FkbO/Hyg5 family n=1 Tax=Trinickia sp. LjRoot230 TaxID=3342288 RepID=UPI003F4FF484